MIKAQTLTQIVGLRRRPKYPRHDMADLLVKSKRYKEAHTLPRSSSVADPSHSPIERGQRHGPRESVWIGGLGRIGSGFGVRYKNKELKKGRRRCFSRLPKFLTRSLIINQRSLDG